VPIDAPSLQKSCFSHVTLIYDNFATSVRGLRHTSFFGDHQLHPIGLSEKELSAVRTGKNWKIDWRSIASSFACHRCDEGKRFNQ